MEMLIGGRWQPAASGRTEEMTSPFDGAAVGTVPVADAGDVRAALDRAEDGAVRAIREIDAGNVQISWTPLWRADLMPYGGLKASGIGKEGPRSAVAEMTDVKTVVLHGRPW